jgi:uncharacterized protein (UPF0218 family)
LSDEIVVTESVRQRVRRPLGRLIKGSPAETRQPLASLVSQGGWTKVISVGDGVTRELIALGITPDVAIVDGNIERKPIERIVLQGARELVCPNRPGTINRAAYKTVERALKMRGPVIVRVEGEEDLLGLVVMAEAPLGSLMLYGQPGEGVVAVLIDEKANKLGRSLIAASSQPR